MTIADSLLSRLDGVKQTDPGKWIAICPAHDDRAPSLSIRHTDDRLLIHCFGGCDPLDVVHSVGMELADLFDKPRDQYKSSLKRPPIDYKQLCILSQHWALILDIFLEDVVAGKEPNEVDVAICRHAFAKFCQFARADL